MERHTDDKNFVRFVNGQLSHDELVAVERDLIDTGEATSSLEASIVSYRANYTEAEDILGIDEIFYRRNAINRSGRYSIVSEPLKNDFMTQYFNKNEMAGINSILEELDAALSDDRPFADVLADFYLHKCPGATRSEAQDVIEGLKRGIMTCNENLHAVLNSPETEVDYIGLIENATRDMSLEEKYDFLVNYLVAVQLVSADNLDMNLEVIEGLDELKGRIFKSAGEITEGMIDDLESRISDVLNNSVLILPNLDSLENLVNDLASGSRTVEEFGIGSKEDLEQKLKMSLSVYIAYKQNSISSVAGEEVTPESIGIGIAAGVEESKVIEQVRAGKKDVNLAIKIIKAIGAIALFSILVIGGACIVSDVVLVSTYAFLSILGTSVLGTILSCCASFFLIGIPLVKAYAGMTGSVMTGADRLFDKLAQDWIPDAVHWTMQHIQEFLAWISSMRDKESIVTVDVEENTSGQVAIQ